MNDREKVTEHIVDVFNSVVKQEVEDPVSLLEKEIDSTKNTDIPERSLLYSLLADHLYEEGEYEEAHKIAYDAYHIDSERKEVLHSLMNIHLPRTNQNDNNENENEDENENENDEEKEKLNKIENPFEDDEKAKDFAKQLEDYYPDDIQALNMASIAYSQLGLFDDALRVLLTAHELLVETEKSLRRSSIDSNDSISSIDSINSINSNDDEKSVYRETIEQLITKTYLSRYRQCPDEENFIIMKYLIELISFKCNSLTNEQLKMANEEVCERAEYVLDEAFENNSFVFCQKVINMVTPVVPLTKKLIGTIASFYQKSNQLDLGVKYYTNIIEDSDINVRQRMALFYYRGGLYRELGMTKEASQDFDTSVQLGKLRSRTRGGPDSPPINDLHTFRTSVFNETGKKKIMESLEYDNKDEENRENMDPNIGYNYNNDNNKNPINEDKAQSPFIQNPKLFIDDNHLNVNNQPNKAFSNNIYISPRPPTPSGRLLDIAVQNESDDENEHDVDGDKNVVEKKDSENELGHEEVSKYKEEILSIKQNYERIKSENLGLNSKIVDLKNESHRQGKKYTESQNEIWSLKQDIDRLKELNEQLKLSPFHNQKRRSRLDNNEIVPIKTADDSKNGEADDTESLLNENDNNIDKKLELEHTQQQLQYFMGEWAEYKTKYEKMKKEVQTRDDVISELKIESQINKDKANDLTKQLKIIKDANSKTKKLRRLSQQTSTIKIPKVPTKRNNNNNDNNDNNNNKINDNDPMMQKQVLLRRKQLVPSQSPWIDRVRMFVKRQPTLSSSEQQQKQLKIKQNQNQKKKTKEQFQDLQQANKEVCDAYANIQNVNENKNENENDESEDENNECKNKNEDVLVDDDINDVDVDDINMIKDELKIPTKTGSSKKSYLLIGKSVLSMLILFIMLIGVLFCTIVTFNVYKSISVINSNDYGNRYPSFVWNQFENEISSSLTYNYWKNYWNKLNYNVISNSKINKEVNNDEIKYTQNVDSTNQYLKKENEIKKTEDLKH